MTRETAVFLDEIQELLERPGYEWAAATLTNIAATVGRFDQVTEGQRRAVQNITAGARQDVLPSQRFRGSRRYENWQPAGR